MFYMRLEKRAKEEKRLMTQMCQEKQEILKRKGLFYVRLK